MRPSKQYQTGDENLSLLEMQVGDASGSKWRERNRKEGAGSPLGEQARSRLRRTLILPGGRPGISIYNAQAFRWRGCQSLDDYIGPVTSDFTMEGRNVLKTTRFNFEAKNEKEPVRVNLGRLTAGRR